MGQRLQRDRCAAQIARVRGSRLASSHGFRFRALCSAQDRAASPPEHWSSRIPGPDISPSPTWLAWDRSPRHAWLRGTRATDSAAAPRSDRRMPQHCVCNGRGNSNKSTRNPLRRFRRSPDLNARIADLPDVSLNSLRSAFKIGNAVPCLAFNSDATVCACRKLWRRFRDEIIPSVADGTADAASAVVTSGKCGKGAAAAASIPSWRRRHGQTAASWPTGPPCSGCRFR